MWAQLPDIYCSQQSVNNVSKLATQTERVARCGIIVAATLAEW